MLEALRAGKRQIETITIPRERATGSTEITPRSRPREGRARSSCAHVSISIAHLATRDTRAWWRAIAAARYAEADELWTRWKQIGTADPPLVLGLDGVEDPRNMGSILRTAECAGVHGVFIAERRAVGLTSVVAKVAAGALEYVPVARVTNLVRLIEQLKERNIWVVGAAAEANAIVHGLGLDVYRPRFFSAAKDTACTGW